MPGPKYALPTTIGTEFTDPTLKSSPAYSLGMRRNIKIEQRSPGPRYNTSPLLKTGPPFSPAASILSGFEKKTKYNGIPGPGRYKPEYCSIDVKFKTPPSYSIGFREEHKYKRISPGANKYILPTTICASVPDKKSAPCFSILGRNIAHIHRNSPGPARYGEVSLDVVKVKAPEYTQKGPWAWQRKIRAPGTKYLPNFNVVLNQQPEYSFGTKHSTKETLCMTNNDRAQWFGF